MARIQSIVGQKIVIYNIEGKILILKRSQTSNGPGNRDLPGGGILLNESPIECLEREIGEETGLQNIKKISPIHTGAKTGLDGTHGFFVGYSGYLDTPGEIVLSHEHDEYLWVDPQDVDKYSLQVYRAETVKKSIAPGCETNLY